MIKVDIIVKNWLDTSTSPSALGRFKIVEGQVVTKGILIENCFYFFYKSIIHVCEQVSPCKSSGVKSPFPTVPICSAGPHCPITIAPSAYSCLPFVCTPIIHICQQVSPCISSQVGSNPHSPLPPYVPPGPIAPLLLRQARILASLLHANHSCL